MQIIWRGRYDAEDEEENQEVEVLGGPYVCSASGVILDWIVFVQAGPLPPSLLFHRHLRRRRRTSTHLTSHEQRLLVRGAPARQETGSRSRNMYLIAVAL